MALNPSDMLNERDSGATWVRKANKLLGQAGVDLGATEAARDAAGGHAAQADSAAASAASAAALAAQIRAGQRQGGPLIMPSLLLDWQNNAGLDPRVRYSRAGDAWESNPAGILTRSPANVWGWNGGRSVWPALTNIVTAAKTNPTATTNLQLVGAAASPSRFSVADDMAAIRAAGLAEVNPSGRVYKYDRSDEPSSAAMMYIRLATFPNVTDRHALSVFVRGTNHGGDGLFALRGSGEAGNVRTLPALYERVIWVTVNAASGNGEAWIQVRPGTILYFIVPQVLVAPYAGPVIPADSLAAATRLGEFIQMPTASWYRQADCTIVMEQFVESIGGDSTNLHAFSLSNGTTGECIRLMSGGGPTTRAHMYARVAAGGVSAELPVQLNTAPRSRHRYVIRCSANELASSVNGGAVSRVPVSAWPAGIDRLGLGSGGVPGISPVPGSVFRFVGYPGAVSDAEMMSLGAL